MEQNQRKMTARKFIKLLPAIREVAKTHGYAVGVHGSLARDFDLIAVAWSDGASSPTTVAEAIREVSGGRDYWRADPMNKPHGRIAFTFDWKKYKPISNNAGYCDLSVVNPSWTEDNG